MSRPRATFAQLEANGAFEVNPGRYASRTLPPVPKGALGYAPKHLNADQKKIWKEIIAAAPSNLLGSCDAIALELAVRLTYKMRFNSEKWTSTDAGQLINIMGKLGGTPGDRQRLNVTAPTEKAASEWDAIDA